MSIGTDLPIIRERFERTTCDCGSCVAGCKAMPGFLAIGDLQKIVRAFGPQGEGQTPEPESPDLFGFSLDQVAWIMMHFCVSDGTTVGVVVDEQAAPGSPVVAIKIRKRTIATINPKQVDDGSCIFLTSDNRCRIHEFSPYGCSHFDTHQTAQDGAERLRPALEEIIGSSRAAFLYGTMTALLRSIGNVATPIGERKARFRDLEMQAQSSESTNKPAVI